MADGGFGEDLRVEVAFEDQAGDDGAEGDERAVEGGFLLAGKAAEELVGEFL